MIKVLLGLGFVLVVALAMVAGAVIYETRFDIRQDMSNMSELSGRVDSLEVEVLRLTAEVAPRKANGYAATTFSPAPFLGGYLEREIAGTSQLRVSFWEERLSRAQRGLMGGSPTYEDVLAEKEYYEGWLDYANWLTQDSDGFTPWLWQVGDEDRSRLDFLQLQLYWLRFHTLAP